jgi:hypothetical protein
MSAARRSPLYRDSSWRRHTRHNLSEVLTLTAPGVLPGRIPALTEDVSFEGLCLIVPDHIPVATAVLLQWNGAYLVGQVRHSNPHGNFFRAGIKLDRVVANIRSIDRLLQKAAADKVRLQSGQFGIEFLACTPQDAPLQPMIA